MSRQSIYNALDEVRQQLSEAQTTLNDIEFDLNELPELDEDDTEELKRVLNGIMSSFIEGSLKLEDFDEVKTLLSKLEEGKE